MIELSRFPAPTRCRFETKGRAGRIGVEKFITLG